MATYAEFLRNKAIEFESCGITGTPDINPLMFPFQRDITLWAARKGRAAIWADCGLGKSWMALEWSRLIVEHTKQPVLILTPLAVAQQFVEEGERLDIAVNHCFYQSDVGGGINVTNYDRLHCFDPGTFAGVVLDESSILKDYTSKTRNSLIESFRNTPYRLCCTATPSPNDYMELGNHAEFLGAMTRAEMLSMFFVHDGGSTQNWRIKGHAAADFWRWICSWAVAIRMPSDLGYDDDGYRLPALRMHQHIVGHDPEMAARMGMLFLAEARGLQEQRIARKESIGVRVQKAADIANGTDRPVVVWCDLNAESESACRLIPDAVEVHGSMSIEAKESAMLRFRSGEIRVLVTKPSIAGWGVNWQHCADVVFLGISNSFEAWYQAIRRTWRFGQSREVNCHIVISDAEGAVVSNLERKREDAEAMTEEMIKETHDLTAASLGRTARTVTKYEPAEPMMVCEKETSVKVIAQAHGNGFSMYHADCVDAIRALADESVGYTVFSPPFDSLYTYSNSDRDMGNTRGPGEFSEHFGFLIPELLRVTRPGRLVSFHCMNLPTSKARDGYIGLRDFRGELIAAFVAAGWIYHSEVCIWKDPVTSMQRTKALGLLHKTIRKDSAMSRMGIPDYLVTMRKPGENAEPIAHSGDSYPVSKWQQVASPIWMDINPSETLQGRSAREFQDERHICPLQLEVIERGMELWSNPGDLVFSPFAGIGSEGFVALRMERRFIGFELKESYFKQAVANLQNARLQTSMAI